MSAEVLSSEEASWGRRRAVAICPSLSDLGPWAAFLRRVLRGRRVWGGGGGDTRGWICLGVAPGKEAAQPFPLGGPVSGVAGVGSVGHVS